MKNWTDRQKLLLKFGIAFLCGAAGVGLMFMNNNPFVQETAAQRYRYLCDAFSVPGLLLILVGVLSWLAGEGAFAGLGYVFRYVRRSFIPGGRTRYPHETYYEYVQKRKGKKSGSWIGFLSLTGMLFLLVGLVFLVLYYRSV